MSDLGRMECPPWKGGGPPMTAKQNEPWQRRLGGEWQVVEDHHLRKEYRFKDFRRALAFTNQVGELAEQNGHHPDLHLAWGKVGVTIWTHKIGGGGERGCIVPHQLGALSWAR